jgi:hypothetical protein
VELVMRRLRVIFAVTMLAGVAACEHPIAVVTPHAEVADLVFADSASGTVLARTTDNRTWSGAPLHVCVDQPLTLVPQAIDFRGLPVDLVSRRDLEIRGEAADPIVAWEPLRGRGRLIPLAAGTTRIRFLVWHLTHADLVSPWMDVIVSPRGACLATR